ncbi:Inhibin beta A chain, partial [Fragariocoptes setiger]
KGNGSEAEDDDDADDEVASLVGERSSASNCRRRSVNALASAPAKAASTTDWTCAGTWHVKLWSSSALLSSSSWFDTRILTCAPVGALLLSTDCLRLSTFHVVRVPESELEDTYNAHTESLITLAARQRANSCTTSTRDFGARAPALEPLEVGLAAAALSWWRMRAARPRPRPRLLALGEHRPTGCGEEAHEWAGAATVGVALVGAAGSGLVKCLRYAETSGSVGVFTAVCVGCGDIMTGPEVEEAAASVACCMHVRLLPTTCGTGRCGDASMPASIGTAARVVPPAATDAGAGAEDDDVSDTNGTTKGAPGHPVLLSFSSSRLLSGIVPLPGARRERRLDDEFRLQRQQQHCDNNNTNDNNSTQHVARAVISWYECHQQVLCAIATMDAAHFRTTIQLLATFVTLTFILIPRHSAALAVVTSSSGHQHQQGNITATYDNDSNNQQHTSSHNHRNEATITSATTDDKQTTTTNTNTKIDTHKRTSNRIDISEDELRLIRTEYFKYKILSNLGIEEEPVVDTAYLESTRALAEQLNKRQSLMNSKVSSNRSIDSSTSETLHHETVKRSRRSLDCSANKDDSTKTCCKETFYVNFTEIGWNKWIVHPPGYYANYCHGQCDLSNSRYYHSSILSKFSNVISLCCSPRKMSHLSLLYVDQENRVHQKIMPDMVVESCDCA